MAQRSQFHLPSINLKLHQLDLFSIKIQWDEGLSHFLQFIILHWHTYSYQFHAHIKQFVRLNIDRVQKFSSIRMTGKYSTKIVEEASNIYDLVYPGMTRLIDRICIKLSVPNIHNSIQLNLKQASKVSLFSAPSNSLNNKQKHNILMTPSTKNKLTKSKNEKSSQHSYEQESNLNAGIAQQQKLGEEIGLNEERVVYVGDKNIEFYIDEKRQGEEDNYHRSKTLKEDIQNCKEYFTGDSRWADLYISIDFLMSKSQDRMNLNSSHFFENIQNQRVVNNQCLGCSKFFYQNLNIIDDSINYPIIKVFPSIREVKDYETKIKDTICGMLNSGGGIILFDCIKQYRQIFPKGETMTQLKKQDYEQIILSYLRQLYPKITYQVTITFVPILDFGPKKYPGKYKYTGNESILKANYEYDQHKYIGGKFVVRVKVLPTEPTQVYFWQTINNQRNGQTQRFCYFLHEDGEQKRLKARQILRLIKKKMKIHYIPDCYDQKERRLLKTPASLLDHECEIPEAGVIANNSTESIHEKKKINLQEYFREMSLIITKKRNFPKIKQNLIKKNIPCQIFQPFQKYKFKNDSMTAVLYHNVRFQEIYKQLSKPEYSFGYKSPTLISIAPYLKLQNRNNKSKVTQKEFDRFYQNFSKEFPSQFLRIYKYLTQKNDQQYYCETQSKLSTIFMYHFLNEDNEKTKFKIPVQLSQFNQQTRRQKFICLFHKKYSDKNNNK